MASTTTTQTTETTTILPPALAFLVSNFHSLVNIKLDASNYLLWRIQVESVVDANGFFGYLDGSVQSPPPEIRNAQGEVSVNPAFALWKLIDSQLKSCLKASLSQTTLPYVLGLRHAYQVWDSLAKRYNTLSETHVQELRDELYSITKTSTIEAYIDKIQEIAQKLTAAGCVVEDDEIIFCALQGLPKAFNGLRTAVRAVRTRGHKVSFDELVTMMKSEDAQLSKETSEVEVHNTVLVASHGSHSGSQTRRDVAPSLSQQSQPNLSSGFQSGGYSYGGSGNQNSPQQFASQQYFPNNTSQQYFPNNNSRNFNRGRGGKPKSPCDICGRNNHSTYYCHYRPNGPGFQWRGYTNTPQFYPTMYSSQGFPIHQNVSQYQRPDGGFRPHVPVLPMMQSSVPTGPMMSQHASTTAPTAFVGFTGQCNMPYLPSNYYTPGVDMPSSIPCNEHSSTSGFATQPWYFDSGATNHVTNNVHNIAQPQQPVMNEGILVGNGHSLQVTHSDWAGDSMDRRSTSGFCLFLGSNLISWSAKKQHTVARSSTEAEYRALAQTAADISWVQQLLLDVYVTPSLPHLLWCDNLSAIAIASNPVFHARTKHVEVDYRFVREKVLSKQILVKHVGSLDQIADIFTKPLSVDRFCMLKSKLMVSTTPMSLQGHVSRTH